MLLNKWALLAQDSKKVRLSKIEQNFFSSLTIFKIVMCNTLFVCSILYIECVSYSWKFENMFCKGTSKNNRFWSHWQTSLFSYRLAVSYFSIFNQSFGGHVMEITVCWRVVKITRWMLVLPVSHVLKQGDLLYVRLDFANWSLSFVVY